MTKIKCDHCNYENADPRNVHAHKRKHDKKSFICKRCGQTFTWVEQRKMTHQKQQMSPSTKHLNYRRKVKYCSFDALFIVYRHYVL